MMAGRDISTTKMVFGSTRVIGTCAIGGQAVGTAAALAVKYNCTPKTVGEDSNCWESGIFKESGESVSLKLKEERKISQIRITFDPNLNQEIMISMTKRVQEKEVKHMPAELVRDYTVKILSGKDVIFKKTVHDNVERLAVINTDTEVIGDCVILEISSTYGCKNGRFYASTGVEIKELYIDEETDELVLSCSPVRQVIVKGVHTVPAVRLDGYGNDYTSARIPLAQIREKEPFFRLELRTTNGKTAYSQPYYFE